MSGCENITNKEGPDPVSGNWSGNRVNEKNKRELVLNYRADEIYRWLEIEKRKETKNVSKRRNISRHLVMKPSLIIEIVLGSKTCQEREEGWRVLKGDDLDYDCPTGGAVTKVLVNLQPFNP